jgi:S1-C subfamily serine protease
LGWTAPPASAASFADSDIPAVIEHVAESVVAIIGKPSEEPKRPDSRFNLAHGTGVIVGADGTIITNAHVVKNMSNIVVVTSNGKSYPGKTTHYDEESDLALVKIDADGLKAAEFADPRDVTVGQTVVAIGTPISFALRNSVTVGIISGQERSVSSPYQLLQTDAAINPGNSGGALVNMKGQVVGINTMKFVDSSIDSLGFAIPVNTVQYVLHHFLTYGKVMRPYTGFELEESWEAVVGLPTDDELQVAFVDPDSPAAHAGIQQGDQLLAFDGHSVKTMTEFNELMKQYLPGQTVSVTLSSNGSTVTREVLLAEAEESGQSAWDKSSDGASIDSDRGKTLIGDSHYGWSMKYPAGLIESRQSDDGSNVIFTDAKSEFGISISVEEHQSKDLSAVSLLRKAAERSGETLLEKQYVEQGERSYAKIVGKTSSGAYYQTRAFQSGESIYYAILFVQSEELYQNSSKQKSYLDLLDSFRLSFDERNAALKDISVYKDGDASFANEYGLTFKLPSDWSKDEYSDYPTYSNKNGSIELNFYVTSPASGDTLNAWTAREQKRFLDSYVESYRKAGQWNDLELADGAATKENRFSRTMGEDWESILVIFLMKDKYKYEIDLTFDEKDEDEALQAWQVIKSSLAVSKDKMNASLGVIQDEADLIDPDRMVTVRLPKSNLSFKVPELWNDISYASEDEESATYMFDGGMLDITADNGVSLDTAVKALAQKYKKSADSDSDLSYGQADVAIAGQPGKKFEIVDKSKQAPYQEKAYVFAKNGTVYTVTIRIYDAAHTPANERRKNQVLASIELN